MKARSVQDLQEQLRAAGLRATLPRVAVLRYLHDADSPASHAEVAEALGKEGFDRATVYRNLIDLTEVGLVRRSDMGDHVWRFERVGEKSHAEGEHPHFICGGCGAIACLPEDAVEVRAVRGAPRALRRKGVTVQLRGLCDSCGAA